VPEIFRRTNQTPGVRCTCFAFATVTVNWLTAAYASLPYSQCKRTTDKDKTLIGYFCNHFRHLSLTQLNQNWLENKKSLQVVDRVGHVPCGDEGGYRPRPRTCKALFEKFFKCCAPQARNTTICRSAKERNTAVFCGLQKKNQLSKKIEIFTISSHPSQFWGHRWTLERGQGSQEFFEIRPLCDDIH